MVPPAELVRHIDFEGARNFRDLGGYESHLGGTTAWGRVFQAAALSEMTDGDLERLAALDVAAVVDLRNSDERRLAPDPVESLHIPVMATFMARREPPDFSSFVEHDHGVAFMRDLYVGLLDHAATEFGQVIEVIAAAAGRPVVFHCTAGKDRTGLVAALLLEVLGVDRESVLDDFTLTEQLLGPAHGSDGVRRMIEHGMAPEAAAGAFGAPRTMMAGVLDVLDARYGGAELYLAERSGVAPDVVDGLRSRLLT